MYYISQLSRQFWVAVKQEKSQVKEVKLFRNETKIFDFRTKP